MLTLTVWIFDSAEGAGRGAQVLAGLGLQRDGGLLGTAIVDWGPHDRRPRVHAYADAQEDLLERPFWPVALGLLFSIPLLGAALAHAASGSTAPLGEIGVSQTFMNRIRDEVVPGTSGLFALLRTEALQQLQASLGEWCSQELTSEVTGAQEAALLELFCP
jgi:uncharacterized membrane protein